ncbi:MAG: hypothetical protein AAGA19_03125 [Pseudomonadota bacterium]
MTIGTILFIVGLALFGAATSLGLMTLLQRRSRRGSTAVTGVESDLPADPVPQNAEPPAGNEMLSALQDMRSSISDLARIQMSMVSEKDGAPDTLPADELKAAIEQVGTAITEGISRLSDEFAALPKPTDPDPGPMIDAIESRIAPLTERLDLLTEAATVSLEDKPENADLSAVLEESLAKHGEALGERMVAISAAATERLMLGINQHGELSQEHSEALNSLQNQEPVAEAVLKSEQVLKAALDDLSERLTAGFSVLDDQGSPPLEAEVQNIAARLSGIEDRLDTLSQKPQDVLPEIQPPSEPSELDLRLSSLLDRLEAKIANDAQAEADEQGTSTPVMTLVEPTATEPEPEIPPKPATPSNEFELLRAYPGLAAMLSRSSEHSRTS